MRNYIPTPTLAQWDAYHQQVMRQIAPALHRPGMWDDLKQGIYHQTCKIERYMRFIRAIDSHRAFKARMRARRLVEA